MYGYGPEFTAIMHHLHRKGKEKSDFHKRLLTIPLINIVVTSFDIMRSVINREISKDEHPGLVSRLKSQIEMMESDLQDNKQNISPKTIESYKAEAKRIKERQADIIDEMNDNEAVANLIASMAENP